MKKKKKILVIMLSLLSVIIISFVIFVNIPFEVEFTLVDEYPIGDKLSDLFSDTFRIRIITQNDAKSGIYHVGSEKSEEFYEYISTFDYAEGFFIFSAGLPVKKVTFTYKEYSDVYYNLLLGLLGGHTMPDIWHYIFVDVKLDENAELTDNYYLYKISDKRAFKIARTRSSQQHLVREELNLENLQAVFGNTSFTKSGAYTQIGDNMTTYWNLAKKNRK